MRYYCIANPIPLIKTIASDNFMENLPLVGTTMHGKLPVTENTIQAAFFKSDHLVLCKTLDDAMILRQLKIEKKTNMKPDFFNNVANYPVADYAIYAIEVDNKIPVNFLNLNKIPITELYDVVSYDLYMKALYRRDTLELPDIDVCYVKKTALSPQLVDFHYYHLNGFKDEGCAMPICCLF